jgi:hypothetical protein
MAGNSQHYNRVSREVNSTNQTGISNQNQKAHSADTLDPGQLTKPSLDRLSSELGLAVRARWQANQLTPLSNFHKHLAGRAQATAASKLSNGMGAAVAWAGGSMCCVGCAPGICGGQFEIG